MASLAEKKSSIVSSRAARLQFTSTGAQLDRPLDEGAPALRVLGGQDLLLEGRQTGLAPREALLLSSRAANRAIRLVARRACLLPRMLNAALQEAAQAAGVELKIGETDIHIDVNSETAE